MICKKCGHKNKQGAKFCEECGANLVGGICPDCGHKNRTDAQFCEECGTNIKGVVKKSKLPKATSKKPGLPLALRIAFGVIGLIGLVSGALTLLGNSTEKAEDNYLNDLEEKSEKCLTSLTSWQALLEGADDDTVFSDNEWMAEHNTALGLVEEYCTTVGWDDDVPADFETANDLLLQSDSEYSEFIRLYRFGFSEMDEEILLQSTDHMLKAVDFTNQAYELLP